jgi:hypothetical protein
MRVSIFRLVLYLIIPFIFIWCVNAIFHAQAEYSVKTWFASFILLLILRYATIGFNILVPMSRGYEILDKPDEDEDEDEEPDYSKHKPRKKRRSEPDWNKPP